MLEEEEKDPNEITPEQHERFQDVFYSGMEKAGLKVHREDKRNPIKETRKRP